MPDVAYIAAEKPLFTDGYYGRYGLFGYYRVKIDGFLCLFPHGGYVGTISEDPIDLASNPEFVSMLVDDAKRIRG